MLMVLAAGVALYFGKQEFNEPGPSADGDTFLVKPNTGVQEIADQLERRGLDQRCPHLPPRRARLWQ